MKQLNALKTNSRYIDVVLTDGEHIHLRAKDAAFASICDITDKGIPFYKVIMCVKFLQ